MGKLNLELLFIESKSPLQILGRVFFYNDKIKCHKIDNTEAEQQWNIWRIKILFCNAMQKRHWY
jgi:hypothetical protein